MIVKGLSISDFADRLGGLMPRPVIDRTGLTDKYDFVFEFTPDLSGIPLQSPPPGSPVSVPSAAAPLAGANEPGSNVAPALEKQLGLKLTGSKEKIEVIMVDHAEKIPTEN